MPKKKFKDTTVGKILLGAATVINPSLAKVLEGVISPSEAIKEITKSDQQNKEIEAITNRWQSDSLSDSWLSKNVRPMVLVWCICIFSLAGILDSIPSLNFHINELWNDTFEKVMMSVVLAYFGGRTTEKATNLFKTNK